MRFRKWKILLIVCLSLSVIGDVVYAGNDTEAARGRIEEFLQRDFNGDACTRDDESLATFNPRLRAAFDEDPGGACVYLNADPLHLINKFRIESVKVDSNRGAAVVTFNEIANINGSLGKRNFKSDVKVVRVKYRLKKVKGKWTVHDPPPMRISAAPILEYYESVVKGEEGLLHRLEITAEQRKVFDANRKICEGLKRLIAK
jgi:hypothetical protein